MCFKTGLVLPSEENSTDEPCESLIIEPPFASNKRCSPIVVAIFNLVATIVGGGVLSVPLAFEKCGIILATVLMLCSAFATDRSLYLLCLCSRYTGASSFGEVGRMAFGPWMECLVSLLLFVFLLFVLVAFMVLVRDIWTPVINEIFSLDLDDNVILIIIVVLMGPFLTRRSLYALRYNCYFGFASASLLCVGICHRAWQDGIAEVKLFPSSMADALYGFPIITLGFLSSYNILPVHSSLIRPTNKRVGHVVNGAIGSSFFVTYIFGLVGYLYFGDDVEGNILKNFDHLDDSTIMVGRLGYGTTLMLAMAIITLPCRDNILEVIDRLRGLESHCEETIKDLTCKQVRHAEEGTSLLHQNEKQRKILTPSADNLLIHYGSTFLIVSFCFVGAVAVPGVDVVWNLCGSSMAFLLSFILPAMFYLRIQSQQSHKRSTDSIGSTGISYVTFSWILLFAAVVGAVACTVQSALALL